MAYMISLSPFHLHKNPVRYGSLGSGPRSPSEFYGRMGSEPESPCSFRQESSYSIAPALSAWH